MTERMTLSEADAQLDRVLRPLTGLSLYRENIFRITGVPVDATPRQVRRRREEAAMAARFGAPAGADGQAWMQPASDAEALRSAFEAMRNPVLRLVHELMWLRPDVGDDHPHNRAVRTHAELLHLEDEDQTEESVLQPLWRTSLDDWAAAFASRDLWQRARSRVEEIDDPRLTLAVVRRLEERLPELVVGVSVALAAEAARCGDVTEAWRHMGLLEHSAFGEDVVDRVARTAAGSAATKIERACEEAAQDSGPGKGLDPLHRMLAQVDAPLAEVTTVLGDDDELSEALRDKVAGTINQCAVGYFNETSDAASALPMLRRARELVTDQGPRELIENNLTVVAAAERVDEFGPPGTPVPSVHIDMPALDDDVPYAIAQLCAHGGVNAAAARVRAWRRWTKDPAERRLATALLDDPRALVSPLQNVPSTGCFFVLGGHLYGAKDLKVTATAPTQGPPDHTCVKTYFLTLLWLPLVPVAAHIVGWETERGRVYGGRVPVGAVARWYRLLVLTALPVAVVAFVLGTVAAAYTAVGLVAFTAVCLVLRQIYLYSWVRRYV